MVKLMLVVPVFSNSLMRWWPWRISLNSDRRGLLGWVTVRGRVQPGCGLRNWGLGGPQRNRFRIQPKSISIQPRPPKSTRRRPVGVSVSRSCSQNKRNPHSISALWTFTAAGALLEAAPILYHPPCLPVFNLLTNSTICSFCWSRVNLLKHYFRCCLQHLVP